MKVENATPFLLRGDLAQGEIIPRIWLTGTLGRPVPLGRITLKDVLAFLPSATFTIPDGRIDFFPDAPWVPVLDVRGVAQMPGYEVRACAFGSLNARKLMLRSEPPLPQEALVRFLTTGIAPEAATGLGAGTAPSGSPPQRAYLRPFDRPGTDPGCLQIRPIPTETPGQPATPRQKFLLWDNAESDGFQIGNNGASFLWQFE